MKSKKLAIKAVESVGIENGPAHVEIMMTDSGSKMIELGARMGGLHCNSPCTVIHRNRYG